MPDLRDSYIGGNYRRAAPNFSRFGTRKLAFYSIWVYGISDADANDVDSDDLTDFTFPTEFLGKAGNIIEAIQRGVQLVAEPYIYSDWDLNSEGPNYNDVVITVAVSADTFLDRAGQNNSPVPANPAAHTLRTAVESALTNFNYDYVDVNQAYFVGAGFDQNSNALSKKSEASAQRFAARKSELVAQGAQFRRP